MPERHSSFGKGDHPVVSLLERNLSYIYSDSRTIDSMKRIWGKEPKGNSFREFYEQEKKN